jgi:tetratricopeptide (TPR) repeat protein
MGEVFLAEDTKLRRKVAIKFLAASSLGDERAKGRMLREARAAASLDHPNICAIYEVGEDGDDAFIVMQYIAGETLLSRMNGAPLELRQAIDVAAQIAEALSEAHSHNIIHRDIKPQNVIISAQGRAKVLDFGLAKTIQPNQSSDTEAPTQSLLTEAGFVVGTVPYMSPEQAKGESLDARSDLFSLGALFYECVTGRRAFHGSSAIDTVAKVIHVDPDPPSQLVAGLPPDVDRMIQKSLAKKVESRYPSATEMLDDLRRLQGILDGETMVVEPPGSHPPAITAALTSIVKRRRALVAVALLVLLAVALSLWLRSWRAASRPSAEATSWYERGIAAIREGGYYQATKMLEQAVELDGRFPLAHARLADAYAEIDSADKAKDQLLIATSLAPDRSALSQTDADYLDAIAATVRRDFAAAINFYQKIADEAPASERASAYVDLGRSYEKNENILKAIESYSQAARADSQSATAFLRLGTAYGRRQEFAQANDAFDKAEEFYGDLSNDEGLAEVFFQRGFFLSKIRNLAEAKKQLERALEISRRKDNKYQVVKTQLQLSQVYYAEGDTERAKAFATEAISVAQANNARTLATNGLIDLGYTILSRGEFNAAGHYFNQALEFARADRAQKTEARAKLGLGSLSVQKGNADEAISLIEEALGFYQRSGYVKETSLSLLMLGRAHRNKGEYDVALQSFQQELQLATELGDRAQIAGSRSSIGVLLLEQERYTDALPHIDESYSINASIGSKESMGYDLVNRAILLSQLGRFEAAREALGQAFAIANRPEANYKAILAWVPMVNSMMALTQRRLEQAKADGKKALDLGGTPDLVLQAKHTIGLAQALSGEPQPAITLCEEAVASAKQLNNPRLLSSALLALSEVQLLGNDAQAALTTALRAQAMFARAGQQDSEWRAWLVAARASQRAGDKSAMQDYASRAEGLCAGLQQKWGAEAYRDYLRRPDIQAYRTQIAQILNHSK